jgi:hypothetical protein
MTSPASATDRTAIWAVVTMTGLALTAVTVLAGLGRPLDSIVQLVVMLVPTSIGSLLTLLRVERLGRDVTVVREQTNGHMSKLLEKIPHADTSLTHAIDALGASSPVVPAAVRDKE